MSVSHGNMWTDRQTGVSALVNSSLHPCEGKPTHGIWVLFEVPPTRHRRKGPTSQDWAARETGGGATGQGQEAEAGTWAISLKGTRAKLLSGAVARLCVP